MYIVGSFRQAFIRGLMFSCGFLPVLCAQEKLPVQIEDMIARHKAKHPIQREDGEIARYKAMVADISLTSATPEQVTYALKEAFKVSVKFYCGDEKIPLVTVSSTRISLKDLAENIAVQTKTLIGYDSIESKSTIYDEGKCGKGKPQEKNTSEMILSFRRPGNDNTGLTPKTSKISSGNCIAKTSSGESFAETAAGDGDGSFQLAKIIVENNEKIQQRCTLDLKDQPLKDLASILQTKYGVVCAVPAEIAKNLVTIQVKDQVLIEALMLLAISNNLGLKITDGVVSFHKQ